MESLLEFLPSLRLLTADLHLSNAGNDTVKVWTDNDWEAEVPELFPTEEIPT